MGVRTSVLCEWSWQPTAGTARLPRGNLDQQPVLQHYHQYFEDYVVLQGYLVHCGLFSTTVLPRDPTKPPAPWQLAYPKVGWLLIPA